MLIVKAKFQEHDTQNHNFNVESLNALIVLRHADKDEVADELEKTVQILAT